MSYNLRKTKPPESNQYGKLFKGKKIYCRRCDFPYYENETQSGKIIHKTKKGWICDWCLDPEDL